MTTNNESALGFGRNGDGPDYFDTEKDATRDMQAVLENVSENGLSSDLAALPTIDKVSTDSGAISDVPEGGFRAWSVVFGSLLMQFCSSGYIVAFGVFQDYYTRIFMTAHSTSQISWIGSSAPFIALILGLPVGRLYDKGYCMSLIYIGSFIIALCMFMLSFAKPNQYYVAFLCQGLGVGIGTGMTYITSLAVVSQYFHKKQATAFSIVFFGLSLGSVLSPIIVNNLLQKSNLGFATAIRIQAGIFTVFLIFSCLLIKPRLPPAKNQASLIFYVKKFSREKEYLVLLTALTLYGLGIFFPSFYLQLASTTHGLSKEFAFYSLVILNGCACLGTLFCSVVSRKVKIEYLAVASAAGCGLVNFGISGVGSLASVVLIGITYGFSFGILISTLAPVTYLLADTPSELGFRLGIAYAFVGAGELSGPPIMGALLSNFRWWRPAIFAGTMLLSSSFCFAVVGIMVRRRKLAK